MSDKILLIDDEPNILSGYKRQLRKDFQIYSAVGGKEGLELVAKDGPFAVIVSDMQMPEMNGIQFLNSARDNAPDSVRMMLTGNADQQTAMDAVNDGNVFRFLTKPCTPEEFKKVLDSGVEQYRLITAGKELLSKTLSGSVCALTDVLSLVNPTAFGNTANVRGLVRSIGKEVKAENAWELEIAAMLSQVGCISIPEATLDKLACGESLSGEELGSYQSHPQIGHDLIAKIPRLKNAAEIIAYQQKNYDGSGVPSDGKQGEDIPFGARVLKLAIDAIQLTAEGKKSETVLETIRKREGWYDPSLVDALATVLKTETITISVPTKRKSSSQEDQSSNQDPSRAKKKINFLKEVETSLLEVTPLFDDRLEDLFFGFDALLDPPGTIQNYIRRLAEQEKNDLPGKDALDRDARAPYFATAIAVPIDHKWRPADKPFKVALRELSENGAKFLHSRAIQSEYIALSWETTRLSHPQQICVVSKKIKMEPCGLFYDISCEFVLSD